LAAADRERAERFAEMVTPAVTTRALEVLGTALIDMRRSPDPRVDLEVALVRLTASEVAGAGDPAVLEALVRRVEKLEAALAGGAAVAVPGSGATPPPPPLRRTGPAAEGRARLAAATAASPSVASSEPAEEVAVQSAAGEEPVLPTRPVAEAPAGPATVVTREELVMAWGDDLLDRLGRKARARFSAARFVAVEDGTAVMALPNEPHMRRCEDMRSELEQVLSDRFGGTVPVRLVVDGDASAPVAPQVVATPVVEESIDLDGLVDADMSEGSAVEKLTQAFPGASLVDPA
jgi:DNA polymerase-3 subunit gamma/tau